MICYLCVWYGPLSIGAQAAQVDEPRTLFIFELEAYPEIKIKEPSS